MGAVEPFKKNCPVICACEPCKPVLLSSCKWSRCCMKAGFSLTGQEKTHVQLHGASKLWSWTNEDSSLVTQSISFPNRTRVAQTLGTRLVAQWAIDHVTLSESVSLVSDNFQTETISKLKTARWVAQLVEYEFCYSCDHYIDQIQ